MLAGSWDTFRLFLCVLAATAWGRAAHAGRAGPGAAGLAVFGALTGISALAALFLGILLAG